MWYHTHIGGERCPIVDTWWQTETGAHMITPLPGRDHHQARLGHLPAARHLGRGGRRRRPSRSTKGGGYLTITQPWPSMLRGIWGDPERYRETYWSDLRGPVLRRRRLQDRRRRLLLAARPGRRRDERVGPPGVDHRGRVGAGRPSGRGRGGGRRRVRRHHRPGHHRLRHPPRHRRVHAPSWSRRSASTWPRRSARRPVPRRSSWCPTCPRPAAARSCAGCCATWPRDATSATPPPWPTRPVVDDIRRRAAEAPVGGLTPACRPRADRRAPRRSQPQERPQGAAPPRAARPVRAAALGGHVQDRAQVGLEASAPAGSQRARPSIAWWLGPPRPSRRGGSARPSRAPSGCHPTRSPCSARCRPSCSSAIERRPRKHRCCWWWRWR